MKQGQQPYKNNQVWMQLELTLLKENPLNEKIYRVKEDDLSELKNSIENFGLQNPIVINQDNTIISGHRRFNAVKQLNWTYVETITKKFNTKDEEILFLINENKYRIKELTQITREAEVLFEIEGRKAKQRQIEGAKNKVTPILEEPVMPSQPYSRFHRGETVKNVGEQVGIKKSSLYKLKDIIKKSDSLKDREVSDFLEGIANKESVDAAHKLSKETPEFIKQVKDKIDSGIKYHSVISAIKEAKKDTFFNNKETNYEQKDSDIQLFNDDCRNILKTLEDGSIDLLLTDPPYGINFVPSVSPEKGFDNDTPEYVAELMEDCLKLWQKKLKKDAHLYIFTGWGSYPWLNPIITKYFEISNVLVWVKNNNSLCDFDKRYAFQYELIIFARQYNNEGNERLLRHKEGTRLSSDVLHFNRCSQMTHSCEKPVDLLEFLINNSTSKSETVLDCFAGTFNSAIAAKNLERKYIGIEKDSRWYNIGLHSVNQKK